MDWFEKMFEDIMEYSGDFDLNESGLSPEDMTDLLNSLILKDQNYRYEYEDLNTDLAPRP